MAGTTNGRLQPVAHRRRRCILSAQVVLIFWTCLGCATAEEVFLNFKVVDTEGDLIACRIHLEDESGTPQRAMEFPFWRDHFVCPGTASVQVAPGSYTWTIERGPEYEPVFGTTEVPHQESVEVTATLNRIVALREEGWLSGDLHVHRPIADIDLLMAAEDLDFAPVIEWWNRPSPDAESIEHTEFETSDGRVYLSNAGEDEREGGALLYFGLKRPLDLSVRSREVPSPMLFVERARAQEPSVWIDIEKPFWWDVPVWLAMANPDSIGIAQNHMHRGGVLGNEAWGRPRDLERYPGVSGNGMWTQEIYYQILNAGIRLPPSAGSASGVLPNPVGYNRVYVQLEGKSLNRQNWFSALKAGRCFVTNGPLLRVKANNAWPGKAMQFGKELSVELQIELSAVDPVSHVEVIHNGRLHQRIAISPSLPQSLTTTVQFSEPGWFLVRAIADVEHTFRFASTAPWYLERRGESNQGPKASDRADAAQFFLDWIDERIDRVRAGIEDPAQRDLVLRWHHEARNFWTERLQAARP